VEIGRQTEGGQGPYGPPVKLDVTGTTTTVIGPAKFDFRAGTTTIVYAIGSAADKTLTAVTQSYE
jgi:hypothetical protein